jgi:hypothetical protein
MSLRRGSATALNASEVVAARAMPSSIHSDMGICQAFVVKIGKENRRLVKRVEGNADKWEARYS